MMVDGKRKTESKRKAVWWFNFICGVVFIVTFIWSVFNVSSVSGYVGAFLQLFSSVIFFSLCHMVHKPSSRRRSK